VNLDGLVLRAVLHSVLLLWLGRLVVAKNFRLGVHSENVVVGGLVDAAGVIARTLAAVWNVEALIESR
jgi:hypothetical protein